MTQLKSKQTNFTWEQVKNWNEKLETLLGEKFNKVLSWDLDYVYYEHPKTKMKIEYNNLKDYYSIFPYGDSEYYKFKKVNVCISNVDTLDEVKQYLAKQKIIK